MQWSQRYRSRGPHAPDLADSREIPSSPEVNGNLIVLKPLGRPPHAFTYTLSSVEEDCVPPAVSPGTPLLHDTDTLDRQHPGPPARLGDASQGRRAGPE